MKCSCCRTYTKWLYRVVVDGTELFLCPKCIELPHRAIVDRTMNPLEIVEMHKQGKTFAEIGRYFGVTRQRVHQIYKQWEYEQND